MALLSVTSPIAFILGTNESPLESNVVEIINDLLVLIDGKGDFLLAGGFADLESLGRRANLGAEINLSSLKDLIQGEPRILLDNKLGLRRNRAEQVEENGREKGEKFGREEFVGYRTKEHHGGGKGSIGGEDGGCRLRNGHLFEIEHLGGRRERRLDGRRGVRIRRVFIKEVGVGGWLGLGLKNKKDLESLELRRV